MVKTISKKSSVKASAAKTSGKPSPGDKPWGLIKRYSYIKYKTVMILNKEKKQKLLSFKTQALRHLIKTS